VGKERLFFIHTHTQVANRGQFGKNHFEFGKNKDFHFLTFENSNFWVKEEEKSKIFHLLNFENAYFWVKEEDENLYKISL